MYANNIVGFNVLIYLQLFSNLTVSFPSVYYHPLKKFLFIMILEISKRSKLLNFSYDEIINTNSVFFLEMHGFSSFDSKRFCVIDVVTNILCKRIYGKMCNSLHIYNNIEVIVSYMYLYVVVLRTTFDLLWVYFTYDSCPHRFHRDSPLYYHRSSPVWYSHRHSTGTGPCHRVRLHVKTRHVFVKHECPQRQQSQNMTTISKSYILSPPNPRGMWCQWSVRNPWMNLQSKFGYFNITQTLNVALFL